MSGKRIYGIDLGTTYSCIAYVDEHGKPVVLPNAEGELTTPSVVYFENPSNYAVGQTAKDVAATYTDRVVSAIKRSMGDEHFEFSVDGKTYRPQDISAFILKKVVEDAQTVVGDAIRDVVITCPAYFGVNQREATRQAGEIAGLNVLYVLPEPTAAAVAYGIEAEKDQVVMVYDLGGGTFDVTLIEIKTGAIRVVATGGDHELGGKNWDDALVSWYAERFASETGSRAEELLDDPETFQELLLSAERVKKRLSSTSAVKERVRYEGERVEVEVTREKFDEITGAYLERTMQLTHEMLRRGAEKGCSHIDTILLVGGSTYMPQVMRRVQADFKCEIRQLDPNQIVAKGAAIFGYKLQLEGEVSEAIAKLLGKDPKAVDVQAAPADIVAKAQGEVALSHGMSRFALKGLVEKAIINVTSKSFGVLVIVDEAGTEAVNNLVVIDDEVPRRLAREFYTHAENQILVDIEVMENVDRAGEESTVDPALCNSLGKVELRFKRALPKRSPIDITFDLGPDGTLRVFGKDKTTLQEAQGVFTTQAILTREALESSRRNLMAMSRRD